MPLRSGSVSVQIWLRYDRKPLGLPSVKGELANSAVAIGCSARLTRNFFTMSASDAKSRFTCTVQVRSIMSRPRLPLLGHVVAHDLVAALGHPRDVLAPPLRIEAQAEQADAQLAADCLHLVQVLVHLGAGLVDGLQRRAGQLELPARLKADVAGARCVSAMTLPFSVTGSQPNRVRPVQQFADARIGPS